MNARKRLITVTAAFLAGLPLVSCGGLPRTLRNQIASEKQSLQQAGQQWQRSQKTVQDDLAHSPDLFQGTPVLTEWPARLNSAQANLDRAKSDLAQLDRLEHSRGSQDDVRHTEQLLGEERSLRQSAVREAESVEADANSWLDFARNLPHYLAAMQREYDDIRAVDLTPVSQAVAKAGQDWPTKKDVLDERLASLQKLPQAAEAQWQATQTERQDAAAGKATGPETAKLIQANDVLDRDDDSLTHGAERLRASTGQLYDSWDKILADLDVTHRGFEPAYAEKITTVRTHLIGDVSAKKTETSTDTEWMDVPASSYHAVENDLGMVIAHKDAGQFDSDAQNQPQPPGFAYIAPPSQGSNQYGYWTHEHGESVWTFLPQYLLLRELLWGHAYRPIVIGEYNGYETARRAGRTWYGQETPASPPKYGSHGTFTTQRYANSRYVQSGGFAGSSYASNRSAGTARPGSRFDEPENGSAGKRFGGSSNGERFGSNRSGQRFGSPRPTPRMPGRRFGGRR